MEEEEEGQDVLRQRRPGKLAGEETARGGEELTAWRGDFLALAAGGEEDVWVRKRGRRREQARSDVLNERPLVRRPLRDEGAQGRAEKMDGYFWDVRVSELALVCDLRYGLLVNGARPGKLTSVVPDRPGLTCVTRATRRDSRLEMRTSSIILLYTSHRRVSGYSLHRWG